jgi:transcriptional regulator with XRE-family HTH domain
MGRNLMSVLIAPFGSSHPHRFCPDRGEAASVMFEIVRQGLAEIRLAESWVVRICEELCRTDPLGLTMLEPEKQLSDEQSRLVAAVIREQLARRRMSRQHLADQAKISISTLEKALSGRRPFTLATTVRLEEALGVSLRKGDAGELGAAPANLAPGHLGFYSRPAVSWIEGSYVTLRPSFSDPQAIFAYRTEICWDDGASSLIFRESDRVDAEFSQQGLVSVPHQSGHIYLVTNRQGQYRLVIISRPTINREMFGIMTTLRVGRGSELMPVSSPIAYVPFAALPKAEFGRIPVGHACHPQYRKLLRRTVEESFALFLQA